MQRKGLWYILTGLIIVLVGTIIIFYEAGSINFSPADNFCYDSDGELNYYVFGVVNSTFGAHPDYCTQNKYLTEFFCDNSSVSVTNFTCPNGCSNGACINQSICLNFTYSNWSQCMKEGFQVRNITHFFPVGCIGGQPILNQSCKYLETVNITLNKNQIKTVMVNDFLYNLSIASISTGIVYLKLNSYTTGALSTKKSYNLSDGSGVYVLSISYNKLNKSASQTNFLLTR